MAFITDYFLPFIVVLSIIVFIHELGHFIIARRNGVKIDAFSIGFGPEIFGFTDKSETRWKFCVLPLGGYVKMYGDANAASQPSGDAAAEDAVPETQKHLTLAGKTPWQRIKVAAGGPIANFILAFVLYLFIFVFKGAPHLPPVIDTPLEDSVAAVNGLEKNDRILSINGEKPDDFYALAALITARAGKDMNIEIKRGDTVLLKSFKMMDPKDLSKPATRLGISPTAHEYKNIGFFAAVKDAALVTVNQIYISFWGFFKLFSGQVKGGDVGGILAIGDMISKSTKNGIFTLIQFMAYFSVMLGALNLLPVPVLDGGHILLNSVEMARGKPLSQKIEERVYMVGFTLILTLMLYATWNDLLRYKVFTVIGNLFGLS